MLHGFRAGRQGAGARPVHVPRARGEHHVSGHHRAVAGGGGGGGADGAADPDGLCRQVRHPLDPRRAQGRTVRPGTLQSQTGLTDAL
eukprot:2047047-Rhodomonas_salina.1